MRQVQNFIARVAKSDSTVLVRGESGTGKELWRAPSIATAARRQTFVAINCAAFRGAAGKRIVRPRKGSFTGAIATRKASWKSLKGDVFLDEVGELAHQLQAKLLRALQEHEFDRVGSTRPLKLNARVIAATNKNLEEAIKDGEFRQDLYYRLNVVSVMVPRCASGLTTSRYSLFISPPSMRKNASDRSRAFPPRACLALGL